MADDPTLAGIRSSLQGAVPYLVGALIALGLILHAVFPRYEWQVVGDGGHVIVVYDRWTGQYQRAEYQQDGEVRADSVFRPF